jgi:hypothetical protein
MQFILIIHSNDTAYQFIRSLINLIKQIFTNFKINDTKSQ